VDSLGSLYRLVLPILPECGFTVTLSEENADNASVALQEEEDALMREVDPVSTPFPPCF